MLVLVLVDESNHAGVVYGGLTVINEYSHRAIASDNGLLLGIVGSGCGRGLVTVE